jgi:hypothetical protein
MRFPVGRDAHEYRVEVLEVLSDLIGCFEEIGGQFPDSRRPDVLRINKSRQLLVVGEAKNSESPNTVATLARLFGYLRWVRAHISRRERIAIFALCCRRTSNITAWQNSVASLAFELGLSPSFVQTRALTPHDALLCCVFGTAQL